MLEGIIFILILLPSVTIHEYAHGWVAKQLGDPTAKEAGRLTLNPIAHIDPVGTVLVPIMLLIMSWGRFAFAWAKPVPVNPRYFRNPRRDMMWVGMAGPCANIGLAILAAVMVRIGMIPKGLYPIFFLIIFLNLILATFNLVPIPPLDGSRILTGLLPRERAYAYMRIEAFGGIILLAFLALLWFGLLNKWILLIRDFSLKMMGG